MIDGRTWIRGLVAIVFFAWLRAIDGLSSSTISIADLLGNETNVTNATEAPRKETPSGPSAPWWIIIIITLCFLHLAGGVAFATYIRLKGRNALMLGRLRKRERIIVPTGPPPVIPPIVAPEKVGHDADAAEAAAAVTAIAPHEPSPNEGSKKGPPAASKVATAASKVASVRASEKTMTATSSGDTMKGVAVVPAAEGKVVMPSARTAEQQQH